VVNVTEADTEFQPERFNPSPYIAAHIISTQTDHTKNISQYQVERFNPSPHIESHTVSTMEATVQQKKKKGAAVSSQPEGFTPSADSGSIMLVAYVELPVHHPERFNPAPFIESRILAASKVAEASPAQQEAKPFQPAAVPSTFTNSVVAQSTDSSLGKQVTSEAAASFSGETEPRGAYEKLKSLLESGKQLEEENVPLFGEPKPEVPLEDNQHPEGLVGKPTEPEGEAIPVRTGPRTAAEYMEEAKRIADDHTISLYSPRVLIMKHLVIQQQKLHDMLEDMRHQCNNVDTQVKTIRNERFIPQTYVKKKHPWSRLTRL